MTTCLESSKLRIGHLVQIRTTNKVGEVADLPYEKKGKTYVPVQLPRTPFAVPIQIELLERPRV